MTVVAAIDVAGFPVVLGDALLSSKRDGRPNSPREHYAVPTVDDLTRLPFRQTDKLIAGLENKVAIIQRKRLAIGWAGNRDRAADVIEYLKTHLSNSPDLKRSYAPNYSKQDAL
jgi:hypothetical protein